MKQRSETGLSASAEDYLRDARVGRLATVDETGQPYLVPFCFVWHSGAIYMALDAKPKRVPVEKLKRVRNLLERPSVGVIVDRWDEDWSKLAYVQIRGKASLLTEGAEREAALRLLREKYSQYRSMPIEDNPTVKIVPSGVTTWGSFESPAS